MPKLWKNRKYHINRLTEFFRLGLGHNSLANYYTVTFQLVQHHKYSLTEIENLIPFERDIYIAMLQKWIEEENERQKQRLN